MFRKISQLWNWVSTNWKEHGFEFLVVLSIAIIIILALFRIGKKGTWADSVLIKSDDRKTVSRRPPQESKGEIECRRVLETMFNKPFPKARPDILRNPVTSDNGMDNNLELDCYNAELKIACEYQGIQHYKYIPFFHKTRDSFQNQKYRDLIKKDMCQKNGIFLIEVPYTVKVPDIKEYIHKKLNYNK